MALSFLQMAAIAGGTASKVIDRVEKERQDKIFGGVKDWIKETVPRAGEYKTKATVYRRKIEDQLEQVISKYFGDSGLNKSQQTAGARALLADHGYKIENIDKAYQQSSALNQIIYNQQSDAYKSNNEFKPFTTNMFVNSRLANLGKLKTNESVEDSALYTTRVNLGDFNATPEGVIKGLEIYDGSQIFRKGYNEKTLRNMMQSAMPSGMSDYSGELPKLAKVERKNVVNTLDAFKEVQLFKLNDARLRKNISEITKNEGDGYKWKVSDWQRNYKSTLGDAINKSGFAFGEISFPPEGGVILPMGSGQNKAKYEKAKSQVLDNSFMNFVNGAIVAKQHDTSQFLSFAIPLANNVSETSIPLINQGQDATSTNIDYNRLISGRVYRVGNNKGIWMLLDKDAEGAKRGMFSLIPR